MANRLQKQISFVIVVILFILPASPVFAAGIIKEGLYKYYLNDEIKGLEYYEDYERNGVFFEYYSSGEIKRLSWYENGQPNGMAKVYSEDGQLLRAVVYRDGQILKAYQINAAGQLTEE